MRFVLLALTIAGGLSAWAAMSPAEAWHDQWGRWHPNHDYPGYYRHSYASPGHHYWRHHYWHRRYW